MCNHVLFSLCGLGNPDHGMPPITDEQMQRIEEALKLYPTTMEHHEKRATHEKNRRHRHDRPA